METKKSIAGSIFTLITAYIGQIDANKIAIWIAIGSGAVTIGYTIYKWIKDIIRDFK